MLFVWQLFCSVFVILPPPSFVRSFILSCLFLLLERTNMFPLYPCKALHKILPRGGLDLMYRPTCMPNELYQSLQVSSWHFIVVSVRSHYRNELMRQFIGPPCGKRWSIHPLLAISGHITQFSSSNCLSAGAGVVRTQTRTDRQTVAKSEKKMIAVIQNPGRLLRFQRVSNQRRQIEKASADGITVSEHN